MSLISCLALSHFERVVVPMLVFSFDGDVQVPMLYTQELPLNWCLEISHIRCVVLRRWYLYTPACRLHGACHLPHKCFSFPYRIWDISYMKWMNPSTSPFKLTLSKEKKIYLDIQRQIQAQLTLVIPMTTYLGKYLPTHTSPFIPILHSLPELKHRSHLSYSSQTFK